LVEADCTTGWNNLISIVYGTNEWLRRIVQPRHTQSSSTYIRTFVEYTLVLWIVQLFLSWKCKHFLCVSFDSFQRKGGHREQSAAVTRVTYRSL